MLGRRCEAVLACLLALGTATAAEAQTPVPIASGLMEGALVRRVAPIYPATARAAQVWGSVVLHAIIDPEGRVDSLSVVSGPEALREAALKAVWHWRYRPYRLNGQSRAVDTTVTVNFSPSDPKPAAPPGGGTPTPAARPPSGPVRVSSGVLAGTMLTKVMPVYPDEAWRAHVSGTVVLYALIGTDGRIKKLKILSGPEMLRQSAVNAVSQWTYRPYILDGEPVEVETTVIVLSPNVGAPPR